MKFVRIYYRHLQPHCTISILYLCWSHKRTLHFYFCILKSIPDITWSPQMSTRWRLWYADHHFRSHDGLIAHHRLSLGTSKFVCLLDQRTQSAEPVHNTVHHEWAIDSLLLPHFPPDLSPGPDTDGAQDCKEPIETAALSDLLGSLTSGQARNKVCDNAHGAVAKASEQTICPFTHD